MYVPHIPTTQLCLNLNLLHQCDTFVKLKSQYRHFINYNLQFIHQDSLFVLYSMSLDKCILTCICHYIIILNSFTALRIPCVLPIYPSFPLTPLTTTDLTTTSFSFTIDFFPHNVLQLIGIMLYYRLFIQASFTQQYTLEFLPYLLWLD